jgi:hypothetical protein
MCMKTATNTIPDGMPPLIHFPRVWHVGTTVLAQKKPDSHAGSGLAVSLHPRSWRRIAKLAGPLFRFEKANGVFADMRACFGLPQLMQQVWDWAQQEDYAQWQPLYHVTYYESEAEERRRFTFTEKGQALAEYEALQEDDLDARYEEGFDYAPTARMRVEMMHTTPPLAFVRDFAVFLFLEHRLPRLDGVWWDDTHRPELLSAPHGAIFRHQLSSWSKFLEEG